jgi:hypothetical protein
MDVLALEAEVAAVRLRLDRIVAQADASLVALASRRKLAARVGEASRRRARRTALLLG